MSKRGIYTSLLITYIHIYIYIFILSYIYLCIYMCHFCCTIENKKYNVMMLN